MVLLFLLLFLMKTLVLLLLFLMKTLVMLMMLIKTKLHNMVVDQGAEQDPVGVSSLANLKRVA
jgi:hypothetical protein